ncbi:hypothetical protein GW17_00057818 [Ensete ventricosum]|nr:hypothetical protein GW17_00057818 [Ensete ventricosum]
MGSPSSHQGKSTLMRNYIKSVAHSSFLGGLSELSPCCNFVGLGDFANSEFREEST